LLAVARFADDRDVRVLEQQVAQPAAGDRLVVHDHDAHGHGAPARKGSSTVAAIPPAAGGVSVSDAAAPYIVRRRSRVLDRPTPSPAASPGGSPAPSSPSSRTETRSTPCSTRAATSRRVAPARYAAPRRTAFPTSGWSSMSGTRAARRST